MVSIAVFGFPCSSSAGSAVGLYSGRWRVAVAPEMMGEVGRDAREPRRKAVVGEYCVPGGVGWVREVEREGAGNIVRWRGRGWRGGERKGGGGELARMCRMCVCS